MTCSILDQIKASFDKLWRCKQLGDTLEIVVPYVSTMNEFISLFITERGTRLIVADGGYASRVLQESESKITEQKLQDVVLDHYKKHFKILSAVSPEKETHYYKSVDSVELLSAAVFELAQFTAAVTSLAGIELGASKEDVKFKTEARTYITEAFGKERVAFQTNLPAPLAKIRVSAYILDKKKNLNVIQYITGSNHQYFQSSISRASVIFEALEQKKGPKQRIALFNDAAEGYSPTESMQNTMTGILGRHATDTLNWTDEKERLKELIPV